MLSFKVIFNHTSKRQFVVLPFRTNCCIFDCHRYVPDESVSSCVSCISVRSDIRPEGIKIEENTLNTNKNKIFNNLSSSGNFRMKFFVEPPLIHWKYITKKIIQIRSVVGEINADIHIHADKKCNLLPLLS